VLQSDNNTTADQTEARNATARMDDEPDRALPERGLDDRGVVAREQTGAE
jgi:hypothetical protein